MINQMIGGMTKQMIEAVTESYLLAKGVRDVAVLHSGGDDERFEGFLKARLALPACQMGCFTVDFIRRGELFIIYRQGYRVKALELIRLFKADKPNHGRVGEILGYHPDIIYRGA